MTEIHTESSSRFRTYPAYRDSGVEWLSKIPAHWNARRLKYVARVPLRNGIGEAADFDNPEWPRYVRITDIAGPRALREDTFRSLPPELAGDAPFSVGDLLLAAVGATYGKSYLHTRDIGQVCYAGYLVRLSPSQELDSGFAAYWTESAAYWSLVQSRVVQATIQNFSAAKYRDLVLPLPSLTEQRGIVTFLDRETARIDALIAKKERLIELLQEQRIALITRAVTKGLDPTAPMKDSGVEWLGEIPAHWEAKPLRWALSVRSGDGLPNTAFELEPSEERHIPVVGGNGVMGYADRSNTSTPCVALGRVGALCGNVHLVDPPAWITDNALVLSGIKGFNRGFLALFLDALDLNQWANQSAQPLITGEFVKAQRALRPPVPEQQRITEHSQAVNATSSSLIEQVQHAIWHLAEIRTAIISAAVMGKIDVREAIA